MTGQRCILVALACAMACRGKTTPGSAYGTVDGTPELSVGSTDSGVQFVGIGKAFRQPSGVIVVADTSADIVALIDPISRAVTPVGRKGSGPGEFESVDWIGQCHRDSIFAWDARRVVISVFAPNGKFAREIRPPGSPWRVSCSSQGDRLVIANAPVLQGDPISATPYFAPITLLDYDGDSIGSIASVKLGESRALGHLTQLAVGPHTIYVGTSDSFVVDRYDTLGLREAPLRVVGTLRAATDSDYQRELLQIILVMRGDTARTAPIYRRLFGRIPRPKFMPAYRAIALDSSERVWVELSRPGEAVQRWRVTSKAGAARGDIALPRGFRLLQPGNDFVLGAQEMADGDEHVAMYRLVRRDAATP